MTLIELLWAAASQSKANAAKTESEASGAAFQTAHKIHYQIPLFVFLTRESVLFSKLKAETQK